MKFITKTKPNKIIVNNLIEIKPTAWTYCEPDDAFIIHLSIDDIMRLLADWIKEVK